VSVNPLARLAVQKRWFFHGVASEQMLDNVTMAANLYEDDRKVPVSKFIRVVGISSRQGGSNDRTEA